MPKLGERFTAVRRRKPEGRHGDHVFPGHLERLSGCGHYPHVGCRAKDVGHQARRGLEEVLTVVEDQEQLAISHMGQQDRQRLGRGLVSEIQRGDHRVDHQDGVADLGQLDPPGTVREPALEVGRHPNRQAGLSDASRPDETDETSAGQGPSKLRQLPAASHEGRRLGGKVADPTSGPGHDYASNQQFGRCCRRGPVRSVACMIENAAIQRVEVTFVGTPPVRQIERASGVSEVEVDGQLLRCLVYGSFQPFLEALRGYEVVSLSSTKGLPT
jgi:hypothetical protein